MFSLRGGRNSSVKEKVYDDSLLSSVLDSTDRVVVASRPHSRSSRCGKARYHHFECDFERYTCYVRGGGHSGYADCERNIRKGEGYGGATKLLRCRSEVLHRYSPPRRSAVDKRRDRSVEVRSRHREVTASRRSLEEHPVGPCNTVAVLPALSRWQRVDYIRPPRPLLKVDGWETTR